MFKRFKSQGVLKPGNMKKPAYSHQLDFVADAPVECVVLRTSAANVQPSARVRCHLPRNTSPFLGHYGELHHADVTLLLNKKAGSMFGPCAEL